MPCSWTCFASATACYRVQSVRLKLQVLQQNPIQPAQPLQLHSKSRLQLAAPTFSVLQIALETSHENNTSAEAHSIEGLGIGIRPAKNPARRTDSCMASVSASLSFRSSRNLSWDTPDGVDDCMMFVRQSFYLSILELCSPMQPDPKSADLPAKQE